MKNKLLIIMLHVSLYSFSSAPIEEEAARAHWIRETNKEIEGLKREKNALTLQSMQSTSEQGQEATRKEIEKQKENLGTQIERIQTHETQTPVTQTSPLDPELILEQERKQFKEKEHEKLHKQIENVQTEAEQPQERRLFAIPRKEKEQLDYEQKKETKSME
jgi:hypothetical protein